MVLFESLHTCVHIINIIMMQKEGRRRKFQNCHRESSLALWSLAVSETSLQCF